MNETQNDLQAALKKLDETAQKIVDTNGYTEETEQIRVLQELIKEQLSHENTDSATS